MYTPGKFKNDDKKELLAFMQSNPFGCIVTVQNHVPVATHIPFEVMEEDGFITVYGHISAANPQASHLHQQNALFIFSGPHAYVSAAWYNHVNVSTWNYCAVHASGVLELIEGTELEAHLRRMMAHYDAGRSTGNMEHMSYAEFSKQMKGVAGFKMKDPQLQGSWKLSQNRNDEDYTRVVKELLASGNVSDEEIATLMMSKRPHLFQAS
jgi:transcriptional regulator